MFSILHGTYFSFSMHFKMSSAICFNLDLFKILSSANGLFLYISIACKVWGELFSSNDSNHCQSYSYIIMFNYFHHNRAYKVPLRKLFTTQSTLLTTLKQMVFENIMGKGENAGNQHFLLFPQCFLPFENQFSILQPHLFCRLQMPSIWTSLRFCQLRKG